MLTFERQLWDQGYRLIAGVDEVGRGCLAGVVVAAAIIFPVGLYIEGVKDSKQLTPLQRERMYREILTKCMAVGIGCVNESTIDVINIKQASKLAMKRAVNSLRIYPEYLLLDAETINLNVPQLSITKGDNLSHSIAAASIVAKVFRDRMCAGYNAMYPEYGFNRNKGYFTREHVNALKKYGPCEIHRRSFLRNIIVKGDARQLTLFSE